MRGKKKGFGSNFAKMDATPGVPDEESPELTDEFFDRATLSIGDVVIRRPRKRGRPAGAGKKVPVTIRLDQDIVQRFRASGRGWQTRLNDAVRSLVFGKAPKRKARKAG